jgi:hypothetical protein
MLTSAQFQNLNRRGFWPLAGEEEEAFLERAARLQSDASPNNARGALELCQELFDVAPDWVQIVEQQKGLAPWQGAVLWIHGAAIPLIQVSPRLKKTWLGRLYTYEEVLAHELIHAVRLPLASSRFEEIVAYQTSRSPVRAYMGPIIRHPYEVYVLLIAVFLGWVGLLFNPYLLLIPWVVCVYGIARLVWSQRVFKRCRIKIKYLIKDKQKALAFAARLTDREVKLFESASLPEIKHYITQAEQTELRWRLLVSNYI